MKKCERPRLGLLIKLLIFVIFIMVVLNNDLYVRPVLFAVMALKKYAHRSMKRCQVIIRYRSLQIFWFTCTLKNKSWL